MTETLDQATTSGHGVFSHALNSDVRHSSFVNLDNNRGPIHITPGVNVLSQATAAPWLDSMTRFTNAPVDFLSPHFTGRDEELEQLKKFFNESEGNLPTRCAIYGMPGVGKTQLALRFADTEYTNERFSHIFWIPSTTAEKLQIGLEKVFHVVRPLYKSDIKVEAMLAAVRHWLEVSGPFSWLLIFDNVTRDAFDLFQDYISRSNTRGRILYTTRTLEIADLMVNAVGQRHHVIGLDMLNTQEAAKLFLDHTNIVTRGDASDVEAVEKLVNCIGRLPLAIAQAASFRKISRHGIGKMLEIYQDTARRLEVIEWENDQPLYDEKPVAIVFGSLLDCADLDDPRASRLLKLLSLFDPESIMIDTITHGAVKVPPAERPAHVFPVDSEALTLRHRSGWLQEFWRKLLLPCTKQDASHDSDN